MLRVNKRTKIPRLEQCGYTDLIYRPSSQNSPVTCKTHKTETLLTLSLDMDINVDIEGNSSHPECFISEAYQR